MLSLARVMTIWKMFSLFRCEQKRPQISKPWCSLRRCLKVYCVWESCQRAVRRAFVTQSYFVLHSPWVPPSLDLKTSSCVITNSFCCQTLVVRCSFSKLPITIKFCVGVSKPSLSCDSVGIKWPLRRRRFHSHSLIVLPSHTPCRKLSVHFY